MEKYKFLGKPDKRFPNLVTDNIYELELVTFNPIVKFLTGVQVEIRKPIHCPYSSWYLFYKNWEKV